MNESFVRVAIDGDSIKAGVGCSPNQPIGAALHTRIDAGGASIVPCRADHSGAFAIR